MRLIVASSSSFHTLLRHALIALGHTPPEGRRDVAKAVETVLGADVSPLHTVLSIREGKTEESKVDPEESFDA